MLSEHTKETVHSRNNALYKGHFNRLEFAMYMKYGHVVKLHTVTLNLWVT